MQRRELFTSLFTQKREKEIFPPYYNYRDDFEKCRECQEKPCMKACEEEIIVIKDGKPSLDFLKSGCTFCDACARVCEIGVLKVEFKSNLPKLHIYELSCLAWQKTICSACKDVCLDRAIEFSGLFSPVINDRCTGCGFCVGVCPANAIGVERI